MCVRPSLPLPRGSSRSKRQSSVTAKVAGLSPLVSLKAVTKDKAPALESAGPPEAVPDELAVSRVVPCVRSDRLSDALQDVRGPEALPHFEELEMTARPEANNRTLASNHCAERFEPDERHDPKGWERNDEKNLT